MAGSSTHLETPVPESSITTYADRPQGYQEILPFKYHALPSRRCIRVLKLEPGSCSSPIQCSLSPHDIDTGTLPFEAISYVWGISADRKEVICDGQRFSVRTNLFAALQTFRHTDKVRILWADAICINQDDAEEKNYQVPLMRLIYTKASKVLIWLGHEEPETVRLGLNALCRIVNRHYSKAQQGGVLAEYMWDGHAANTSDAPSTSSENTEAQDFKSLGPLFASTWFTRVWVIQEAALPFKAITFWAKAFIDFRHVGLVAEYVTKNHKLQAYMLHNTITSSVGICNCGAIHDFRDFQQTSRGFYTLLHSSDGFNVTDPRDRIFGLLGLRTSDSDPESEELFVKPDYNLSVLEVYEDVVTKLLVGQKIVQVLSMVQHGSVIPNDRKSWATDWHKRRYNVFGKEARMTAGDMPPCVYKPVCDVADCVAIQGIAVGDIASVISDETDTSASKDITARRLKTLLKKLQENYTPETIAWTLTAGFSTRYILVEDHGAHLAEYNAFLGWDFEKGPPDKTSDVYHFFELVHIVLSPRHLFITTKGYLCLGPAISQEGDIVSVLFGGNVPYMLRPVGDHYRLVGECYLHSVMEGQGVEEWKKSGEPATDFHIY